MRPKASTALVLLAATACFAPATARAMLAGAAALLFEAAPFVFAGALAWNAARRWGTQTRALTWAARIAGCGCGQPAGAVSLAAFALCWVAFGAPLAVARAIVAVAASLSRHGTPHVDGDGDPIGSLTELIPWALAGSLGAALLGDVHLLHLWPLAFALGALTGALSPCTAGAVALASALRTASPAAAAGLLCTAGIVSLVRPARAVWAPAGRPDLAAGAVAVACIVLAAHHGAGFVHPRIVPLVAAGAALAALAGATGRNGTAGRVRWLVPGFLLSALALGAAPPALPPADATSPATAFAGQRLHFVGVARRSGATTSLVRFVITCCRADASAVGVHLDRALAVADGSWIDADGRLVEQRDGLVLRVTRAREIRPPADPFAYR